jgi:hypothetical protein
MDLPSFVFGSVFGALVASCLLALLRFGARDEVPPEVGETHKFGVGEVPKMLTSEARN